MGTLIFLNEGLNSKSGRPVCSEAFFFNGSWGRRVAKQMHGASHKRGSHLRPAFLIHALACGNSYHHQLVDRELVDHQLVDRELVVSLVVSLVVLLCVEERFCGRSACLSFRQRVLGTQFFVAMCFAPDGGPIKTMWC